VVVDEYYGMFQEYPVTRDIWSATLADKALRDIDAEDTRAHAALFERMLGHVGVEDDGPELSSYALVVMYLLCATVRLAITLPEAEARRVLEDYKVMAARDLLARFGA